MCLFRRLIDLLQTAEVSIFKYLTDLLVDEVVESVLILIKSLQFSVDCGEVLFLQFCVGHELGRTRFEFLLYFFHVVLGADVLASGSWSQSLVSHVNAEFKKAVFSLVVQDISLICLRCRCFIEP